MSMDVSFPHAEVDTNQFITRVYGWMSLGLTITGIVAAYVAGRPDLLRLFILNHWMFYGLMILELGLVFAVSSVVRSAHSSALATGLFLLYAAVNGLTLSFIFLLYTSSSISSAFFVTAGTFAVMSMYGYVTKTDLTGFGNFCMMGLFGVIIASVVNIFWHSPALMWATTYISVFVFIGLTAYDTQRIKAMNVGTDEEGGKKAAISGALLLYLDFINLFLSMLRIMGRRRD